MQLTFLQPLGLGLDLLGALILVLPDDRYVASRIEQDERIAKLKQARRKLSKSEAGEDIEFALKRGEEGFDELITALSKEVSIRGDALEVVKRSRLGSGDVAEVRYTTPEGDSEYAVDEYLTLSFVYAQIESEIQSKRRKIESTIARCGAAFLLVGFSLQIVTVLLS